MKAFVNFPRGLYRNNPYWVPPMWGEERHAYDGKTNVMLRDNNYLLPVFVTGKKEHKS